MSNYPNGNQYYFPPHILQFMTNSNTFPNNVPVNKEFNMKKKKDKSNIKIKNLNNSRVGNVGNNNVYYNNNGVSDIPNVIQEVNHTHIKHNTTIQFDILGFIQVPNSSYITIILNHEMNGKLFDYYKIIKIDDFNQPQKLSLYIETAYYKETIYPLNYMVLPLGGLINIPKNTQLNIILKNKTSNMVSVCEKNIDVCYNCMEETESVGIFKRTYNSNYEIEIILEKNVNKLY